MKMFDRLISLIDEDNFNKIQEKRYYSLVLVVLDLMR